MAEGVAFVVIAGGLDDGEWSRIAVSHGNGHSLPNRAVPEGPSAVEPTSVSDGRAALDTVEDCQVVAPNAVRWTC
jgi:hypothetical protein